MAFSFLKPLTRHHNDKKNHEKLGEGWGVNKEPIKEGVTFYVKSLGSTLVEELTGEGQSYGEGTSTVAVAAVISMAKSQGKKLHKVALKTSPRGIKILDFATNDTILDVSIDRIRFCTADSHHEKVFAFIARNTDNETMECHAFLCSKKKMAQAVTLSVAQAFNIAYDEWQEQEKMEMDSNINRQKGVKKPNQPFNFSPQTVSVSNSSAVPSQEEQNSPSKNPSLLSVMEPRDTRTSNITSSTHQQPVPALKMPIMAPSLHNGHQRNHDQKSIIQSRQNWVSFEDDDVPCQQNHLTFDTNLRSDEIDDDVRCFMIGSSREEFTRQRSVEDLLNL